MWLFLRCCLSCRAKLYWDPEHTNASSDGASQLNQQQRTTAQIIPLRSALLSANVRYFPEMLPSLPCQKPTPSPVSTPTSVFSGLCSGICPKFPYCTNLLSKLIHFFNFYVRSSPPTLENEKEKKKRVRKTKKESGDEEKREGEARRREEGRRKERREEWREVKEKGEVGVPVHCFFLNPPSNKHKTAVFVLISSPPIVNVSLSLELQCSQPSLERSLTKAPNSLLAVRSVSLSLPRLPSS